MTDRVLKKATTLKYKDGDKPFIEFPSSNTRRAAGLYQQEPGVQVQGRGV